MHESKDPCIIETWKPLKTKEKLRNRCGTGASYLERIMGIERIRLIAIHAGIVIFSGDRVHFRVQIGHVCVDEVCEGVFLVSHDMFVRGFEHVVCLVAHTFHEVLVRYTKRVGFGCREVS